MHSLDAMRQGANPRRSRSRSNGNGNRGKQIPLRLQTFDSNGPEGRIRGNAFQVFEKYQALARDAAASGDRISAENLFQHAEHYFRIFNADNPGQSSPNNNQGRNNGNGRNASASQPGSNSNAVTPNGQGMPLPAEASEFSGYEEAAMEAAHQPRNSPQEGF